MDTRWNCMESEIMLLSAGNITLPQQLDTSFNKPSFHKAEKSFG